MKTRISLIGVPMDLGGGRRGVDMGPSAIRIAGLERALRAMGMDFEDRGNVAVEVPESLKPENNRARFLREIAQACESLRDSVLDVLDQDRLPLVVGGDHSIACGTVAGISSWHQRREEKIGLIWFDAHGDMNTPETSPSGNIHGMPLASCLGRGLEELTRLGERYPMVDVENAVAVAVRSLDRHERKIIHDSGVRVITMREIDQRGMHDVMTEALEIANRGTAGFHLSFDLDGTDPEIAPGVGTPVPGGTTLRESHLVMELVAENGRLLGLEFTEINPILDRENQTARIAVDLATSALGKMVL
ncbi:MAG: arginase [bacterium]|nr:arginase [Planctomycetota bacterium]HIL52142.1 arginase [Planctomycetota bacterium]